MTKCDTNCCDFLEYGGPVARCKVKKKSGCPKKTWISKKSVGPRCWNMKASLQSTPKSVAQKILAVAVNGKGRKE